MRTIGVIFARGGSKGIPRKNLAVINGRSLLERAITAGHGVGELETVIVSTDDREIASVARQFGAEVPFMRPAELAADSSPEILSWKHAVDEITKLYGSFDVMLSIPPTAPLRSADDLRRCIRRLEETKADLVITICRSRTNPMFNMVECDEAGRATLYSPREGTVARRQDSRPAYDITTVGYAARVGYVREAESLWDGTVQTVEVPRERAIDIDERLDLIIAEALEREG